eukprot:6704621-Prymnesium_polylepis.2
MSGRAGNVDVSPRRRRLVELDLTQRGVMRPGQKGRRAAARPPTLPMDETLRRTVSRRSGWLAHGGAWLRDVCGITQSRRSPRNKARLSRHARRAVANVM